MVNIFVHRVIQTGIDGFHTEGNYYVWLCRNYDTLQERMEQIRVTNEDKDAFYPGINYGVHNILIMVLLREVALQILILTALAVLYLMDYERIHTTEYLVYSSEKGRKMQSIKWLSGVADFYIAGIWVWKEIFLKLDL